MRKQQREMSNKRSLVFHEAYCALTIMYCPYFSLRKT